MPPGALCPPTPGRKLGTPIAGISGLGWAPRKLGQRWPHPQASWGFASPAPTSHPDPALRGQSPRGQRSRPFSPAHPHGPMRGHMQFPETRGRHLPLPLQMGGPGRSTAGPGLSPGGHRERNPTGPPTGLPSTGPFPQANTIAPMSTAETCAYVRANGSYQASCPRPGWAIALAHQPSPHHHVPLSPSPPPLQGPGT